LPATGGLAGRVIAEDSGAPIADAVILVIPVTTGSGPSRVYFVTPAQGRTDQDGRFAFKLAPGPYRIQVVKVGFAPITDPTRPSPTYTIVADRLLDGITYRLQKSAAISGRVLDQQGQPLAEQSIRVFRRVKNTDPAGQPARLAAITVPSVQVTNDLGQYR